MRTLALAASALAFMLPATAEVSLSGADSGSYQIEKTHAFLTWTVRHNGLSGYTVNFTDFSAALDFDSDNPESSTIEVTIDPTGLQTTHTPEKRSGWEEELSTDKKFLNADEFPSITFKSTSAELTDQFEGTVTGDLTFLGVTKPVTMAVRYNGVTNVPWFGQRDVIGFDASTTITRSDWGMTSMKNIVSDEVTIRFSGEFLQDD